MQGTSSTLRTGRRRVGEELGALALVVELACGCRSERRLAVHAELVTVPDASPTEAPSDVGIADAASVRLGELVVREARATIVAVDERTLLWSAMRTRADVRYAFQQLYESPPDGSGTAVEGPTAPAERVVWADARWIVTRVHGFGGGSSTMIHDRSTGVSRSLPLLSPPDGAIPPVSDATRAYLVSDVYAGPSVVYVFERPTGELRTWFFATRAIDGLALDANNLYYLADGSLHARSRTTGADSIVEAGLAGSFAVLDGSALHCDSTLRRHPFDGARDSHLAPACDAIVHADPEGVLFTAKGTLYALDAGSVAPPRTLGVVGPEPVRAMATESWVYVAASDGIRRAARH